MGHGCGRHRGDLTVLQPAALSHLRPQLPSVQSRAGLWEQDQPGVPGDPDCSPSQQHTGLSLAPSCPALIVRPKRGSFQGHRAVKRVQNPKA